MSHKQTERSKQLSIYMPKYGSQIDAEYIDTLWAMQRGFDATPPTKQQLLDIIKFSDAIAEYDRNLTDRIDLYEQLGKENGFEPSSRHYEDYRYLEMDKVNLSEDELSSRSKQLDNILSRIRQNH